MAKHRDPSEALAKTVRRSAPKGTMRIENWMAKPVMTIRPRDSVADAMKMLVQHRINQLPVVVNGRLMGIVTDRDLRIASYSMGESGMAARAHLTREDLKILESKQ